MKLIAIEWYDSESSSHPWVDKDTFDGALTIATEIGHLAEETEKSISIARGDGDNQWGGIITIPKACVLRRGVVSICWETELETPIQPKVEEPFRPKSPLPEFFPPPNHLEST